MSTSPILARRDLLRGAAALVGGSAFGLLPALAGAALDKKAVPYALGYWDGTRFIAAESLRAGNVPLVQARLTVSSEEGGGFTALDAHASTAERGLVPFILWVAPPAGADRTRAIVPTSPDGSLVLVAHTKERIRYEVVIAPSSLREGIYVLAPGKADWASLHLSEEGLVRTVHPMPHIRIDVEQA